MLALIGWPILNRRQMRKRVTVGQYFDSGLPKDRRKKAPRSHLRRLFPLPSFAARLENGARTPNGLVVRAPSAILRSGCFGGWRRPRGRALPSEKQSAFLPIDCPRTGAIDAEPACGAQNRCPLALWASRLQAGGIRDYILHPSRLDSPQPPTPSVVQHGRAGLQPHVEHPLAGLCASRRDLQLTTGKSMTVRREAGK